MSEVEGKSFRLYVDDGSTSPLLIVGKTSSDNLSMSKDVKGNTHKDSGGWTNNTHGQKSWQMASEMFFEETDNAFVALEDSYYNDRDVTVEFRNSDGNVKRSGKGIVTQLNISGPDQDKAGNSVTIVGNGPLTRSTY